MNAGDLEATPSTGGGGGAGPAVLRLLVVEDDEADRLAIRRCVSQSGVAARTDIAASAAEAMQLIGERQYDCVLLDYYLPGVEGPGLLHEIRKAVRGIPVVMFTGRGDEDVAVGLMKSGAMDYIPKASLTPERLASGIRHASALAHAAEQQRVAGEQLRRQEARFRALANSIPQLAWTSDANGSRDWFNQRWFDYTGTSLQDVAGFGWQKWHHPDRIDGVVQGLNTALEAGEPWEDTVYLRGADGEYRWFLSRALPIRDDDNEVHGWIGTNTEVTELLDARTEAEAAAHARDDLIAVVTHDLRNPLTMIRGFGRTLRRELSSGPEFDVELLRECAAEIEASATRMTTLIQDLLDTSVAATGEISLVLEPGDLVRMTREVVESQQRISPSHEIHLSCTQPHIVGVWDLARVERVLTNLVANALKYSPDGGEITVELGADEDEAVVRVSDQGVGIPEMDIPHLFQRFVRGSNVSTRIPGAGLGLASASDIVLRHGGSIDVQSVEGEGSTFTVRLPLNPPGEPRLTDAPH